MQAGDSVAGRFELGEQIGAGGMGVVYRARDLLTGEPVALKVLRGAAFSQRFLREARVLAEIRHPAVVRYVAHGPAGDEDLYLAMELLEGEDLARRLKRQELTIGDSLILVARVASALAMAHARGIVHRDIKPANLFLPGGDVARVKLLDFGIAHLSDGSRIMTETGVMLGTPGYIAPEQARGLALVDARADVFSLGCVLYRCLAGKAPFPGTDLLSVLAKLVFESPDRLRDVWSAIPDALDELVARMMAKAPDERPADGAAVLQAIEALRLPDATRQTGPGLLDPVALERERQLRARAEPVADSITGTEQRLVSIVVVAAPTSPWAPARAGAAVAAGVDLFGRLCAAARIFGADMVELANGSLLAVLGAGKEPTEQAAQAARCALALRIELPDREMVLATGRHQLAGRLPFGEVIDRAAEVLRRAAEAGAPARIRLTELSAGLVERRFEVGGDAVSLFLQGEQKIHESAPRMLLGSPAPFLGRDREMALLEATYDACVAEPEASAVVVIAPAGAGKSRLRHELLRRLAGRDEPPETWVARGDPMGMGSPFRMLGQAIRDGLGVLDGEPAPLRRRKLLARIACHFSGDEIERVAVFVGELAGIPFPDDESVQLRAARRDRVLLGDQMRRAFEDLLAAACRARPVLLVLEDLHWGDLPTVQWIASTLKNLRDLPLLVLALARPEVRELFPRLWADQQVLEVPLAALGSKVSERLVRQVLGERVSPELAAQIAERAAGNAFFLEEMIRAVAEGRGGRLPDTVLAVVEARLDQLEPDARRALRAASVFGKVFWRGGVEALLGGSEPQSSGWIDELVRLEMIAPRREERLAGERAYVFRNALVRDAAYAMLTDADRTLGHRLAATWLEKAGETDALLLAEHFERGGAPLRAIAWHLRAAEQALGGNDFAAVLARAQRGIACGAAGDTLGAFRLLEAEAHQWMGNSVEAIAFAAEAMQRLPRGGRLWLAALSLLALLRAKVGDHAQMLPLADDLTSLQPAERGPHATACARLAGLLLLSGQGAAAGSLLEIAEAAAGAAHDEPSFVVTFARARAIQAVFSGDIGLYLELMKRSAEACERAGDLRLAIPSWGNVAYAYYQLGDYETAERALRDVVAKAARMGLNDVLAVSRHNLAIVLAHQGALAEAREVIAPALRSAVAQSHRRLEAACRIYRSRILLLAGDFEGSEREARATVEMPGLTASIRAYALGALAATLLAERRVAEARKTAEEALEISLVMSIEDGEALIDLVYAEALLAAGRSPEVPAALVRARARLLSRAAKISDPTWREGFLTRVPENARILALARAHLGG